MRDAYSIISSLHQQVDNLFWLTRRDGGFIDCLDQALGCDELAPHPDDAAVLDGMMESDANFLRELAHEIEMRRIAMKSNVLQYQHEAAQ